MTIVNALKPIGADITCVSGFSLDECYLYGDPLQLSCAAYRLRPVTGLTTFFEELKQTDIVNADIEMANNIRSYYLAAHVKYVADLLVLDEWQVKQPSEFKRKLWHFLNADHRVYDCSPFTHKINKSKYGGLLHKLPEFYDHDIQRDDIMNNHFIIPPSENEYDINSVSHRLSFIKAISMTTKGTGSITEFWCKRINDGLLIRIIIEDKNPLISLFKHYISTHDQEFTITGCFKFYTNMYQL